MVNLFLFLLINLMAFLFGGLIGLLAGVGFVQMGLIVLLASYGIAVLGVVGCQCGYDPYDY